MEFVNHTPFPALAFEGIDQHKQAFHVVVLRQTLSYANGQLTYADEQAPLCEIDTFWGGVNASSMRQESDLCQYKPHCDVIVNGTAYAPGKHAVTRFDVKLQMVRPGTPRRLPEVPRGLNPLTSPRQADVEKWKREVAKIQAEPPPYIFLIDKTLSVCGERSFKKQGLLGLYGWELSRPKTLTSLPLRHEYAFGGQCRINLNDPAAKRVAKQYRLTEDQRAQHPDQGSDQQPPVAHTVCESNLVGRGYAKSWYLDAAQCDSLPAPQIEDPKAPITAELFMQALQAAPTKSSQPLIEPAGFGIRAKTHPARRALIGTVDETFIKSDAWLPKDFDFAIWNAAPPDQQTAHLQGNEIIALTNLCPPNAPGARIDPKGNTVLTLMLPKHECFALIRMESGELINHPLAIDTVIVEPDEHSLTLVWRTILAKDKDAPIRVCEARMHTHADRDELKQTIAHIAGIIEREKRPAKKQAWAEAAQ